MFAKRIALAALTGVAILATQARAAEKDIVDTAVAAGSFKTLATALTEAGLVEALKGDGPFTVFAPTDEAFGKLPEGTLEALLKDKKRLTSILTYHVVPGKVMAADVVKLDSAKTLNGQKVTISVKGKGVKVDNANVVKTDIVCSNGVIHVIDAVILPKEKKQVRAPGKTIVDVAASAGSFDTLVTAIKAAGLEDALRADGPYTVFAPTDAAFAKLPEGTVPALLKDADKLGTILKYHVVSGELPAAEVVRYSSARTLAGQTIQIRTCDGVKINDAKVVKTDINASNGIIHVVDSVLLPN